MTAHQVHRYRGQASLLQKNNAHGLADDAL